MILLPTTVLLARSGPLDTGLTSALLVLLLEVVAIAAVGGLLVAVAAAIGAVLLANWFLVPPFRTLVVQSADDVVALVVFVAVAVAASALVEVAARERGRAARADAEAVVLRKTVEASADDADPEIALDQIRRLFWADRVVLSGTGGVILATVGSSGSNEEAFAVDLEGGRRVTGYGPAQIGLDRRVLVSLATAAMRAEEARTLAIEAARVEQLTAADRAKSALLASVGHDLRTPLSAIKVASGALAQDDIEWSSEDRRELIAGIATSADRLDELVSNLLDMSRIEAGAVVTMLVPTALDGVAAAALLSLPGERVDIDLPDDLPLAFCDPGLLERVLENLVSNALRYSPAGSRILIAGAVDDARVLVRVIDHGPGVATDEQLAMFDAFQRLDDRSVGGTGLGLAIARSFTEAMGGTLVPSTTTGGGLTMTVGLPRAVA